ncbi:hypothetical protein BDA99DRAFT_538355 [Phascolomyces articulosus]|uniref:CCHC-type domain-containing protein n=1 Tax=Phascolomyces articulosus TaxID=60185 RepID=A0AAD5PD45_9FUNG|nr:hypothetical protein BDA99DRAFT_538355 [Phascolomyces articulosus]
MFYSKEYAVIDTTTSDSSIPYEPLKHIIALLGRIQNLATWGGMERHCFYCYQPRHTVAEIPDINKMNKKGHTCRGCGSPDHFIHICPKINNGELGDKQMRTDDGSDIQKDNGDVSNDGNINSHNGNLTNKDRMNENEVHMPSEDETNDNVTSMNLGPRDGKKGKEQHSGITTRAAKFSQSDHACSKNVGHFSNHAACVVHLPY